MATKEPYLSYKGNMSRANRFSLSREQKTLLAKLVPLAYTISDWVKEKAAFTRLPVVSTLYPSIILADILIESQWVEHPLAQGYYNKRYSNNLSLIEVDDIWQGKIQKFDEKEYKAYQNWLHFATDYSDLIIFSPKYKGIITLEDRYDQLKMLSNTKTNPLFYHKAETIIDFYSLSDYD